ncbi:hypothetical protein A2210_00670 [Candidatus Woesebacteria bacterium RIFOXYA1_FULL_40_18]|uniref:Glycosyltransferase n=3 Tax=Candidatus Woeseibacteriota TaxID=1752722 RepID=A0A1F8CLM5_9BACT|nr:MAG: hypothetical protein A2210_00670 [Candidatus Woesebacteria bacterium RIFOXYA1_FULL_40_18]
MEKFPQKASISGRKYVTILGVRVDGTELAEVLSKIVQKIDSEAKFYIVTPNPEIILKAQNDKKLREALNSADFSIADGFGLKIAEPSLPIVRGRELMGNLCKMAKDANWKVFFLGGTKDANARAIKNAKLFYNSINIKGEAGPTLDPDGEPISEVDTKIQFDVLDKIGIIQPDILFVGFGCPKQEKWVYRNFKKLNAKCIMVVGGAIDYLAGVAKLPPAWMESLGLEWLWRLFNEPERFGRIINAVVLFPLLVLISSFRHKKGH